MNAECTFTPPAEYKSRLSYPKSLDTLKSFIKLLIPYSLGILEYSKNLGLEWFFDPINQDNVAWDQPIFVPEDFMTAAIFDIVSPSTHCWCTARGKGKLLSMLANRGTFENKKYFSEETFNKMINQGPTANRYDLFFKVNTTFTDGGWAFNLNGLPLETGGDWYGWSGWGGQFAFFNPKENITYSWLRNGWTLYTVFDPYVDSWTGPLCSEYKKQYHLKK